MATKSKPVIAKKRHRTERKPQKSAPKMPAKYPESHLQLDKRTTAYRYSERFIAAHKETLESRGLQVLESHESLLRQAAFLQLSLQKREQDISLGDDTKSTLNDYARIGGHFRRIMEHLDLLEPLKATDAELAALDDEIDTRALARALATLGNDAAVAGILRMGVPSISEPGGGGLQPADSLTDIATCKNTENPSQGPKRPNLQNGKAIPEYDPSLEPEAKLKGEAPTAAPSPWQKPASPKPAPPKKSKNRFADRPSPSPEILKDPIACKRLPPHELAALRRAVAAEHSVPAAIGALDVNPPAEIILDGCPNYHALMTPSANPANPPKYGIYNAHGQNIRYTTGASKTAAVIRQLTEEGRAPV